MIKSQNNQIQLKYLKVLRMLQFFLKELVWISLCIVSGSLNCKIVITLLPECLILSSFFFFLQTEKIIFRTFIHCYLYSLF